MKSEISPSTDGHKSLIEPFYVDENNNNNDDDGNTSNSNSNPRQLSSTKSRRSSLSRQRHSSQSVRNLKAETSTSTNGHKSCSEIDIDEMYNDDDGGDDSNNNNSSSSDIRERTDGLHDLLDNMRLAPPSIRIEQPSSVKKEEQPPAEKKGFRNLLVRHLSKKIVTSSSKGSYLKDTSSNTSDEDDCWEVAVKS